MTVGFDKVLPKVKLILSRTLSWSGVLKKTDRQQFKDN